MLMPRVPTPLLLLAAGAATASFVPGVSRPEQPLLEQVVTAALVLILFEGGLQIGARRMRAAAPSVLSLGLAGTLATIAVTACVVHLALGVNWYAAVLLATAISPTDPAVVFSVLGGQEVQGRSGTVLEGESGANDPVGISLMAALLAAGSLSIGQIGDVAGTFALQLLVGTVVGLVGGRLLLGLLHRLPMKLRSLSGIRVLLFAISLFLLAVVAHGSGFLAVFLAGIVIADEDPPHKQAILRFHGLLASAAEVVAFVILGLTVDLQVLTRQEVWVPALLIGALLIVAVRPLVGFPLLLGSGLSRGERGFVLFAGLKGAVPLLLGTMLLPLPEGERLYGVVVIVVAMSILVQGGLVTTAARLLHVPMRPRSV